MVRALTGRDRPFPASSPVPVPSSFSPTSSSALATLLPSSVVSSALAGPAPSPRDVITVGSPCAGGAAVLLTSVVVAGQPASQEHASQLPARFLSDEAEQGAGSQAGCTGWHKEETTATECNGSHVSSMEISEAGSRSCSQPYNTTCENDPSHDSSESFHASVSTEGSNTSGMPAAT